IGLTFIYVTHDQEEALALSDRLAVMNHGEIEQVGVPQEVYDRPRSRFVAEFLGNSNLIDVEIKNGVAHTSFGEIPLASQNPGGKATLFFRPEKVQLTSAGSFSGTVERVTFAGATQQLEIRSGSDLIKAASLNQDRQKTPPGGCVVWSVAPEAITVFKRA